MNTMSSKLMTRRNRIMKISIICVSRINETCELYCVNYDVICMFVNLFVCPSPPQRYLLHSPKYIRTYIERNVPSRGEARSIRYSVNIPIILQLINECRCCKLHDISLSRTKNKYWIMSCGNLPRYRHDSVLCDSRF